MKGTMIQLTADEARVLGVLVEKEKTVPESYPLTLNAAVAGASQKNNRDPVLDYPEDRVRAALNGLQAKGLVIRVDAAGSRVPKYRHQAGEKLKVSGRELVLLAELLLRGPQTLGELRGRASRMHPMESLEMVKSTLEQLRGREEPMVRQLPPSPGSRAERYEHLLCPEVAEVDEASEADEAAEGVEAEGEEGRENEQAGERGAGADSPRVAALSQQVSRLEAQVLALRGAVRRLAEALGEPDPTAGPAFDVPAGAPAAPPPLAVPAALRPGAAPAAPAITPAPDG